VATATHHAVYGAAVEYFPVLVRFGRGAVSRPCRGRDTESTLAPSGPSAGGRAHCALNTAIQPCTQLLPDESL
jgi:hypothetical protein